jgi:hypothetical protein
MIWVELEHLRSILIRSMLASSGHDFLVGYIGLFLMTPGGRPFHGARDRRPAHPITPSRLFGPDRFVRVGPPCSSRDWPGLIAPPRFRPGQPLNRTVDSVRPYSVPAAVARPTRRCGSLASHCVGSLTRFGLTPRTAGPGPLRPGLPTWAVSRSTTARPRPAPAAGRQD